MKKLLKKVLLKKLEEHNRVNFEDFHLDQDSYKSGYSNGFVQGFYLMEKLNIGIILILLASLIVNFIYWI